MAEIAMPVEIEWAPEERASFQRLTLLWGGTLLVLFPILGLLGLFMRLSHANFFPNLDPTWFYAALTLHGVGMVGLWFITGFSGGSRLAGISSTRSLTVQVGRGRIGRRILT